MLIYSLREACFNSYNKTLLDRSAPLNIFREEELVKYIFTLSSS